MSRFIFTTGLALLVISSSPKLLAEEGAEGNSNPACEHKAVLKDMDRTTREKFEAALAFLSQEESRKGSISMQEIRNEAVSNHCTQRAHDEVDATQFSLPDYLNEVSATLQKCFEDIRLGNADASVQEDIQSRVDRGVESELEVARIEHARAVEISAIANKAIKRFREEQSIYGSVLGTLVHYLEGECIEYDQLEE